MLVLLDCVKPVFGQFGVVKNLNQVFVFFLVLLDYGQPVLGQFRVVYNLNQVFG